MKHWNGHERKVIGKQIHDDMEAKIKMKGLEESVTKEEIKLEMLKEELSLEKIESTYLIPEIENFVETKEVEKIKERIKLWLSLGFPVHIIGPTGCGKTTLAMFVANELGRKVVWINGDEQVTTTDLIGGYSQIETDSLRDKYIHNVFKFHDILKADWIDNPLTIACKHGFTLVYNEFSRTLPIANNILLSVLEEGILELPTKYGEERYIKVHQDFNAIFTSNSVEYAGVHRPQDALLDRLITIYMDYYDFDTEVEITKKHTELSADEAKKIVTIIRSLREALPEDQRPGTRACILVGKGLCASNGYSKDDFKQIFMDVIASKTSGMKELAKRKDMIEKIIAKNWGE